ncbi:hypothetical protein LJ656_29560 [Paraburkholderia sp. MMS20-SJTR3]|uniref:DUF4175 domain-containing protein n=1 Tax=Paraburkholderia sejongensis TaxID=2886946 RepID=A0ABS8K4A8_9BURK|nr:hypothetical protein [Paraburkholderia sp. MMS20-SJTR3]MCC8396744.1 hypothetical protein [Paraburkholderia sp. MMS20-SJTR3]
MSPKHDYWFAAKRYGWGWGLPVRWQGWATLTAYLVLLGVVVFGFRPAGHPFAFAVLVGVLTAAFVAVCWIKGEPARWRWGKD